MLSFVLDQNLGLPAGDEPWKTILRSADVHPFFHDLDQLPADM